LASARVLSSGSLNFKILSLVANTQARRLNLIILLNRFFCEPRARAVSLPHRRVCFGRGHIAAMSYAGIYDVSHLNFALEQSVSRAK